MDIKAFRVESIPYIEPEHGKIFEALGSSPFMLVYDSDARFTYLSVVSKEQEAVVSSLEMAVPGLSFAEHAVMLHLGDDHSFLIPYTNAERHSKDIFADFLGMFTGGVLGIMFIPVTEGAVVKAKTIAEKNLEQIGVKQSTMVQGKSFNTSTQYELFSESDEIMVLNDILSSINYSITKNGIGYRVRMFYSAEREDIFGYVSSRVVVLGKDRRRLSESYITENSGNVDSLVFGESIAERFLGFYGAGKIEHIIKTVNPRQSGQLEVGCYVADSVRKTSDKIVIEPDTLNLGCIISGLPGMGKSVEAMHIIDGALSLEKRPKTIILDPTGEWESFAISHNMYLIKLQSDCVPINLFRCPDSVEVSKFYADLSIILSSAASAGPYREPLEKCMVNAFRRVYKETRNPSPSKVIDEINKSIIEMHAKVTNAGVKYTKHGENIKSSIETLVEIISREEYSERDGIAIEELLDGGIVFCMGGCSIRSRQFMYSLILNQVYAIAAKFDNLGDDKLRMLICIEEAQTVLKDPESPAVEDMRYRIQDFRKQGIGIMLITHNPLDIDPSVRRLCQTKIYFKQGADVAKTVSDELMFSYSEEDEIAKRICRLSSGTAVLNYVSRIGVERRTNDTVFMGTTRYFPAVGGKNRISEYLSDKRICVNGDIVANVTIRYSDRMDKLSDKVKKIRNVRLMYLGYVLCEEEIRSNPFRIRMLRGRTYCLELTDDRSKPIKSYSVVGESDIVLEIL
jgi:hypothetical protein